MKNLPENDYHILKLSDTFYLKYPNPPYKEILKKRHRAYNCLLFQTHYDYFICVPYRSEIHHKYAFLFKRTKRSQEHHSGLDYTKIIIAHKIEYIGNKEAIIDKDEYRETMRNLELIKAEALCFVEDYIEHINGTRILAKEEFERRYHFSTLKYFHKELGLHELPVNLDFKKK